MENALGQTFEHHDLNPAGCSPHDGGSLVTQWTQIKQPENWIEGQISVLIFYESRTSGPPTSFEIYYMPRQAPLGEMEHWDSKVDPPVLEAAKQKMYQLRSYLSGKGGGK